MTDAMLGPLFTLVSIAIPVGIACLAVAATVAPQGMTIATNAADLPLVYANEAFLRMTGFSPSEILGRNCRFLQGQDTDPAQVALIKRALAAGESVTAVLRNHPRDGSAFWNRIAISPDRQVAVSTDWGGEGRFAGPVQFWDLDRFREVHVIREDRGQLCGFSPDGRSVLLLNTKLQLWDLMRPARHRAFGVTRHPSILPDHTQQVTLTR